MMAGDIHVQQNQTLNQTYKMNLDRLNMKVDIDPAEISRAQLIVDSVNNLVYNKLKVKFPQFKMRSTEPLILQGSVADGTKVLQPDEFDYMIPMDLNVDQWDIGLKSCYVNDYQPQIGHVLVQRDDRACKVCNGDVEDRSQYFADVELLYNKNMGLHAQKDKSSKKDKTLLYHRNGLAKIKNKRNAKDKKRKRENTTVRKKRWTIGGGVCKYCRLGNEISSYCVFHGFEASLCELQDYVDIDEIFHIDAVNSMFGPPAITLTVSYKQSTGSEDTNFNLKIDYVPAMCIEGRYFVPKTTMTNSRHWRESFAHKELLLMNEIQTQAPQLFELYRSYKALRIAVNHMEIKADNELDIFNSKNESSFNMTLLDDPTKLVSRLLSDDKPLRLKECFDSNYIITLDSYHLKMALLRVWGYKKKPTVDEEEFVIAVKDATTEGFIQSYFNGNFRIFVIPKPFY